MGTTEGVNMNEITRFDLDMDGSMEPSEHGQWVRYKEAQRDWVGLTDEEILEAAGIDGADTWIFETAYAIEAKLREKNGYGS